jgi:hypothetical protein
VPDLTLVAIAAMCVLQLLEWPCHRQQAAADMGTRREAPHSPARRLLNGRSPAAGRPASPWGRSGTPPSQTAQLPQLQPSPAAVQGLETPRAPAAATPALGRACRAPPAAAASQAAARQAARR